MERGWIDRIEVENFKSYKDHHIIGPFKKFTSIIGPNGCGKSNLMDAISFVLGMKPLRLRSSNLRELVYKAPHESKASEKRTSFVNLVYKYIDDSGETQEQQFKRTIISSNGTSKYEIDGKGVEYKKYEEVLVGMGVIVSARNFLVFQGDVESIASKSPKELTAFIEKISGSDQYKEEYEAKRAEMGKAEDNTLFTFNKKKTINAERKQYKEQKEEAEKFHDLQESLVEMKKKHMLFQLFHIDRDMKKQTEQSEADETSMAELDARQITVNRELNKKKRDREVEHKAAVELEKKIIKKKVEFDKERPKAIQVKESIEHVNKRCTSSREALKRVQQEYEKQQDDITKLKEQLEPLQQRLAQIAKEEQGSERVLSKEHVEEYSRIKDSAGSRTANLRNQREAVERHMDLEKEQLASLQQRESELDRKIKQLGETKLQMKDRVARMNQLVQDTTAQRDELKAKAREREREEAKAREDQEKLNTELNEIQTQLVEAKSDRKETDRDKRFSQALESMKRLFPSVRGRLVELCQPTHKKYDLAITVAMGKYLDAVVVEDEKSARECIQYLKDQRVGTCTFLPLDTIRAKPIDEKLRSTQGAKFVIDLLKFEPFLHNAVLFAVGNTLVAENLQDARRLAFGQAERNRVVTTKGVLIQKSGLISGGSGQADSRASRWDESRVEKLKKQREKVLQQLSSVGRVLKTAAVQQQLLPNLQAADPSASDSHTVSLNTRLAIAEDDLKWSNNKLSQLKKDKKAAKKEHSELKPQIAELEGKIAAKQASVADLTKQIRAVEDDLFTAFCKKVGVKNIHVYEQENLAAIRERNDAKIKISKHVALIQSQIDYQTERDVKGPLKKLRDSIAADEAELKNLEVRNQKLKETNSTFEEELDALNKEQKGTKSKVDELDAELKEMKKQLAAVQKDLGALEKRKSVADSQLLQLRARRHTLYRQARLEEVRLPLLSKKSKSAKKGRGKKRRQEEDSSEEAESEEEELTILDIETESPSVDTMMDSESTQTVESLHKDDKIELDFESVSEIETSSTKEYDDMLAQQLRGMQDVEAEMAKLAPNLKAVERLDDVDVRLQATNTELDSSRKTAKDHTIQFEKVKQLRYDAFMGAFQAISSSIFSIYQELTRSHDSNLHGTAYLHVEDNEEPYLGGIKYTTMPPMKRFRDMEQLSGGEKTVAALALLFAAHTYRPSPFFILDEVDAALDASNVQLVANYIRKRADPSNKNATQFIVISLKDSFYDKSHALVGICRDIPKASSKPFTLDLENYKLG